MYLSLFTLFLFCVFMIQRSEANNIPCDDCSNATQQVRCGQYVDVAASQTPCTRSFCNQRITTDANCVFKYEWINNSVANLTSNRSLTHIDIYSVDNIYNTSTHDICLSSTCKKQQNYSWTPTILVNTSYTNADGYYPEYKMRLSASSNVNVNVIKHDVNVSLCQNIIRISDGESYCTVGSGDCLFETANCTYTISLKTKHGAWQNDDYFPQIAFVPGNNTCFADVGITAVVYDGVEARMDKMLVSYVDCNHTQTYTASGSSILFIMTRNQSNIAVMPIFILSKKTELTIGWAVYVVLSLFILVSIVLIIACIRKCLMNQSRSRIIVEGDDGPEQHKWSY